MSAPRLPQLFVIPPATPTARCRSCNAVVYWVRTPAGRLMPVSINTDLAPECSAPTLTATGCGVAHWADCPTADQHRRRREAR